MGAVRHSPTLVSDALGEPMINVGSSRDHRAHRASRWYGEWLEWMWMLEGGVRRVHGRHITCHLYERNICAGGPRVLVYTHDGLVIPGRRDRVPVRVEFHEVPPYDTYGLPARDYPRVFADRGAASPHRMPDDQALCLYKPGDPEDRCWYSQRGLESLLNLTRNHLYSEMRWRDGGGDDTAAWLTDEADHGFPQAGRRAS